MICISALLTHTPPFLSHDALLGVLIGGGCLAIGGIVSGAISFFESNWWYRRKQRWGQQLDEYLALQAAKQCPYCDAERSSRMPAPWETTRRCTACGQEWTV